ncbi:MAG: hypothetical protein C3F02_03500 [Parcubacteria group bacterium]|nr:MAG: hypothetical protein C3F02_03500 [Parcubacteria group bacterium]
MKKILLGLSLFLLFFVISPRAEAASLILVYPVGKEEFIAGKTYQFSWTQQDIKSVRVYLLASDGSEAEIYPSIETSLSATQGAYNFTIPQTLNGDYYVKIHGYASWGGGLESQSLWKIIVKPDQKINILTDLTEKKLSAGQTYKIDWALDPAEVNTVSLYLYKDGKMLSKLSSNNSNGYSWTVPRSYAGDNYQLLVSKVVPQGAYPAEKFSGKFSLVSDFDSGEQTTATTTVPTVKIDVFLTNRLKGKILLQVEQNGEAWYVRPDNGQRMYLRDGVAAYSLMRTMGLGISDSDLSKIPIGFEDRFECDDSDSDGLCDKLEESLGTDPNRADSDGDGRSDGAEVKDGFNPLGAGQSSFVSGLAARLKGRIVLQVQKHGEAWYINPANGKRYYMPDGPSAYQIMKYLSVGISNSDLGKIATY